MPPVRNLLALVLATAAVASAGEAASAPPHPSTVARAQLVAKQTAANASFQKVRALQRPLACVTPADRSHCIAVLAQLDAAYDDAARARDALAEVGRVSCTADPRTARLSPAECDRLAASVRFVSQGFDEAWKIRQTLAPRAGSGNSAPSRSMDGGSSPPGSGPPPDFGLKPGGGPSSDSASAKPGSITASRPPLTAPRAVPPTTGPTATTRSEAKPADQPTTAKPGLQTNFEIMDQKVNQLFNILSTIVKTQNDEAGVRGRNML